MLAQTEMLVRSKDRPSVKNSILANFTLPDLAAISGFLERVPLKERMVLQEPKKPVKHIFFVETGIVSQRIVAPGTFLEIAVVGYKGAVGALSFFEKHLPAYQSVVLFPGSALKIEANDLYRVMGERPRVREHLSRYFQAFAIHTAQMALCGVRHNLERRVACWICLACDALGAEILPVTHDHLSTVLGLRRAGVTDTLNRFEKQGLIRKARAQLQVNDLNSLRQKACSCYGIITSAYG
jgi:CRP-like cAMP-binding protein